MISKNNNFQTFCRLTAQPTNGSTSLWRQRKKDWHTIEAAFYKRWLKKKTAKKMTEEFEVKIMEPHLKMEDLGKKEKVTGRDIYTHIAWANKMSVLIKGAKLEATTTYIGLVRRELQKLLREKIGIGHTDWMVFLQAVQDVDIDHIKDGVEAWRKEQEMQELEEALKKRIQQLEKLTTSPTGPLEQQMTSFNIGNSLPPTRPPGQTVPSLAIPFTGTTKDVATCFATRKQDPHKTTHQGHHLQRQIGPPSLPASKSTHTIQMQRQTDRPIKRNSQIGQKYMG